MRRLLLLLLFAVSARAQTFTYQGYPLGTCSGTQTAFSQLTGQTYTCLNGYWQSPTGGPSWLRDYGDGSDGAVTISSNTVENFVQATVFTCSASVYTNGSTTINNLIILATQSINLNAGCQLVSAQSSLSSYNGGSIGVGDLGGSSGGSGGGAAAGTAGNGSRIIGGTAGGAAATTVATGGTAGAVSGGNGGNGGDAGSSANSPSKSVFMRSNLVFPYTTPAWIIGGAQGVTGGSSGGSGGKGGGLILLIAPTINIASGVILDAKGSPGQQGGAASKGCGSGGGGGVIILGYQNLVDNGATYVATPGQPGCTGTAINPVVYLCVPGTELIFTNGVNTTTTCPGTAPVGTPTWTTQPSAHVSTMTSGNPTAITVDNAGAGLNFTPGCVIGSYGLGGSGATCTVTVASGAITGITVSGGNGAYTGTTFATSGTAGLSGMGWVALVQAH